MTFAGPRGSKRDRAVTPTPATTPTALHLAACGGDKREVLKNAMWIEEVRSRCSATRGERDGRMGVLEALVASLVSPFYPAPPIPSLMPTLIHPSSRQSLGLKGIFSPLTEEEDGEEGGAGSSSVNITSWDEVQTLSKRLEEKMQLTVAGEDVDAASARMRKSAIGEEAAELLMAIASFVEAKLGKEEVRVVQDVYCKNVGKTEQFKDLRSSINAIRRDLLGRVARAVVKELRRQSAAKAQATAATAMVHTSAPFAPKVFTPSSSSDEEDTTMTATNPFTPLQLKQHGAADKAMVTHSAGPLKKRAKKLIT